VSAGIPFWRKQTFWFGLAVLGPIVIWYVGLSFWPILRAFSISLQVFNALNPELTKFAGLDQYRDVFTSPRFQRALTNTWQYMLTKNALAVPVALLLALLLDRVRSRQAYLFAYFLPGVMSVVGLAVLFRWLYDPTVGPIDGVLRSIGLPAQSFIRSEAQALPSVAGMDAWRSFGFYTILFLAGLMNIPDSIHDAAKGDGAVGWRSLRYVLLPLLTPTVLLVVVIAAIDGFQVFAPVYVLEGPGRSTETLSLLIYRAGLQELNLGFAAATSFVLFAMVVTVSFIQMRLLRERWEW